MEIKREIDVGTLCSAPPLPHPPVKIFLDEFPPPSFYNVIEFNYFWGNFAT